MNPVRSGGPTNLASVFAASRRDILPALAVVCGALVLRLWGVGYGLPHQFHPDESYILTPVLRMSWADLNPHFFQWPANLPIYLLAGVLGVVRWIVEATNWGLGTSYSVSDSDALLLGRLVSVAFGTLTVAAIYLVARMRHGQRLGLAAASLYAVLPYPALDSRYLSPDTMGTFFAFLAIVGTGLSLESGQLSSRRTFGIGIAAGLGTSVKFTMALALAPLIVLLVTNYIRKPRNTDVRLIGWAIAGACAAFLLACPYSVLDSQAFLDDLAFQRLHGDGSIVHIGNTSDSPAWFYLFDSLPAVAGGPAAALFGVAFVAALWSGGMFARTLAVFVGVWLVFFAVQTLAIDRYLLPLMSLLVLLAADLASRLPSGTASRVAGAAMLVAAGWGLTQSIWISRAMHAEDTRHQAGRWIDANLGPLDSFAVEAYGPVSPSLARATRIWRSSEHWLSNSLETARTGAQVLSDLTAQHVDYVIVSSAWYERYFRVGELQSSASHRLTRNAREFYSLLAQDACLVKEWDPNPASTAFPPIRARSDELTHMSAPAGLATLRSGGPTLRLYRLRAEPHCP